MINPFILVQNKSKKRKLPTEEGKGYTTRYLLDYECIKNHHRLKIDDLRE